jgi:hypothetical protein
MKEEKKPEIGNGFQHKGAKGVEQAGCKSIILVFPEFRNSTSEIRNVLLSCD